MRTQTFGLVAKSPISISSTFPPTARRRLITNYKVPPGTSMSVSVSLSVLCTFISACLTQTKMKIMWGYKNIHPMHFFKDLSQNVKKEESAEVIQFTKYLIFFFWKCPQANRTEYNPVRLLMCCFIPTHLHICCLFFLHVHVPSSTFVIELKNQQGGRVVMRDVNTLNITLFLLFCVICMQQTEPYW